MFKLDTLHCLDWLELLRGLEDKSVDMVLTDPPYNTTQLDFEFELDLAAWWQAVKRCLKPSGCVVMTGSQPFTSKVIMSNLDWFRYEWIWEKSITTRFLDANRRPLLGHENIMIFSPVRSVYNPQMEKGEPYKQLSSASHAKHYGAFRQHLKLNAGTRYPKTILRFDSERFGNGNTLHQTGKPVPLFEYLIRTYTHEGALIVDPFVGSGTTAVAAKISGRHYICGDTSPEYLEIAKRRVEPEFGKPPKRLKPVLPMSDLPLFASYED